MKTVSPEQKRAMQEGRQMSAAVDAYLRALGQPKQRGRRVSLEELQRRRDVAAAEAATAEGVTKLKATQTVRDLDERIAAAQKGESVDLQALEAGYVAVAAVYSENHGIDYATWREVGVPAQVLKAAGIKQTRRRR